MITEALHVVEQNPELARWAVVVSAGMLGMALTAKQRAAIIERDDHHCQATAEHFCNEDKYPLEVDHILPQAWLIAIGVNPDFASNLLSKCRNAHDVKHPERTGFRGAYQDLKQAGKNAFAQMSDLHHRLANQRKPYWNTSNDLTDSTRAVQLTQEAEANGWTFPPKKEKKHV